MKRIRDLYEEIERLRKEYKAINIAIARAFECGERVVDIALRFGCSPSHVSMMAKQFASRSRVDRPRVKRRREEIT
jgi:hypothetical protein